MMNDWETDKKIAERIRNALENWEERYFPGAWENFVNRRKRRRRIIFIKSASGIAAGLIGVWLIFQVLVPESNNNRLETNFKTPEKINQTEKLPEKETISGQLRGQVVQDVKSTLSGKSEKNAGFLATAQFGARFKGKYPHSECSNSNDTTSAAVKRGLRLEKAPTTLRGANPTLADMTRDFIDPAW